MADKIRFLVCTVLLSFYSYSATLYVNDNATTGDIYCSAVGNDANPGTTVAPKLTLAGAIAAASSGDIIYVDAGTYTDTEINFRTAPGTSIFTIIGAGTEATIFDGSGDTKPFEQSTYDWELTFSDLTIVDYYATSGGAAFDITADRKLTLTDVVISKSRNSQAVTLSVGISTTSSLTVTRGGFFCNAAGAVIVSGGYSGTGELTLTDVAFIGNSGLSYGSALLIGLGSGFADSTPDDYASLKKCVISGCLFEDNTGTNTSCVYIYNKCSTGCGTDNVDYLIEDCVFRSNTVSSGGSSYGGTVSMRLDNNAWLINHCLFDSNTNAASRGTLAMHTGNLDVTNSKFESNTTTSGEGKDFYSYNALTAQEGSPYFLNDPVIDFNNCFFNSASDNITRNSSTATINLVESGAPTNTSDYSGDGLSQTYTWVDVDEVVWVGDCISGYSLSSGDYYWVGGTGNWSDFSNHWSTTSGGAADHAAYPSSTSNVFFDANSDVGNTAFTVTMDVNGAAKNFNYNSDYATFSTGAARILTTTNLTVSGGNMKLNNVNTTVSATTDLNATITIETATFNADGTFDATGGTIDFTGAGLLVLSAGVDELGTLDEAMGTVEYDGTSQSVFADTYNNLTISTAGTKTAAGPITVNGNLNTAATATCKLDMGANNLTLGGDLTVGATDGLDLSDASCTLLFNGSSDQTVSHAGTSATIPGHELVNYTFESSTEGWTTGGATGSFSRSDALGTFETGNAGYAMLFTQDYPSNADGYITSPTIDMTNMTNMTLSLNLRFDTESSWDGVTLKYSTGGAYSTLGTSADPSWFNDTDVDGIANEQDGWSGDNSSWTTYTISLPGALEGQSTVTFRLEFGSDGSVQDKGCAFDDFQISGTLTGGTGVQATNMTVDKSGGDVILSSAFAVGEALTLTDGYIDATSNNLVLTANASVADAKDASHVKGNVAKTTTSMSQFIFPVGDGTVYRPIAITPDAASETTWTANYQNSAYGNLAVDPPLQDVSGVEYWNLDRSGAADGMVTLWWDENSTVTTSDLTELQVAHFNSGTSLWEPAGNSARTGDSNAGSVSSTVDWSSYSPFTIGATSGTALPITYLGMDGVCLQGGGVSLTWSTGSEQNNSFFEVERSREGVNWSSIGSVESIGNNSTTQSYFYEDFTVGTNFEGYYRLRQVDMDGTATVFAPISVFCAVDSQKGMELYPNPATEEVNIHITQNELEEEETVLQVVNLLGKVVYQEALLLKRGATSLQINIQALPKGVYTVNISTAQQNYNKRLIVK